GPVTIAASLQADPRSPGTLPRHYSPHVLLTLLAPGEPIPRPDKGRRVGLLTLAPRPDVVEFFAVETLSEDGNLLEAATNLFAALRRLDGLGLERVVVESMPEYGIGRAIMDRLRRAATRG
ncbi:MAG TPA: Sua5 family C-terminal domain-containing protein, partial [Candidatus Binatia bacterium]|nr:Sua5 family C-terminal domain-containing protein [Candidatus Binatia bacterium]